MTALSAALLFAQAGFTWSLASLLIAAIIICGLIAIAYIVIKAMGVPIPPWFWQVLGIILIVIVGVLAIKFLMSVV